MPPRGPSAYFLFAEEQREAVRAELQEWDGKAGVAAVGKEIGARWQALSEEQKQAYKERAQQRARELREQQASQAAEEGGGGSPGQAGGEVEAAAAAHEAPAGGAAPPPFGLPTSLVKRIASMDPDVQRISADGVRCMAKATELFVQLLAAKALQQATQNKRKNLRFQDIEAVAGRDRRMQDMGLREFFASDAAFAEVHEREAEHENQSRRANKKPAEEEAKGMRQITAFFPGAS